MAKRLIEGAKAAGQSSDLIMKDVPGLIQLGERHNRLNLQMMELMKEEMACGNNDACVAAGVKQRWFL